MNVWYNYTFQSGVRNDTEYSSFFEIRLSNTVNQGSNSILSTVPYRTVRLALPGSQGLDKKHVTSASAAPRKRQTFQSRQSALGQERHYLGISSAQRMVKHNLPVSLQKMALCEEKEKQSRVFISLTFSPGRVATMQTARNDTVNKFGLTKYLS